MLCRIDNWLLRVSPQIGLDWSYNFSLEFLILFVAGNCRKYQGGGSYDPDTRQDPLNKKIKLDKSFYGKVRLITPLALTSQ